MTSTEYFNDDDNIVIVWLTHRKKVNVKETYLQAYTSWMMLSYKRLSKTFGRFTKGL